MNTNFGRKLAVASLIASLCAAWSPAASARGHRLETVPELATSRLIVKYPAGTTPVTEPTPISLSQARAIAAKMGISLKHLRRMARGADVYELSSPVLPAKMREMALLLMAADSSIEYAEPDALMLPMAAANDPLSAEQWNLFEPAGGIRAEEAWAGSVGSGVVVAVIDTGVLQHADLSANLLAGRDFISGRPIARDGDGRDTNAADQGDWYRQGQCLNDLLGRSDSSWHGTHVAGTIAAVANNGLGVTGVAPGAKVLPLRALGKCGGYTSDIADAIEWASGGSVPGVPANLTPARVINVSLGAQGACSRSYQTAISDARERGSVVVAAAGNGSTDARGYTPANCQGVIAVGASDRHGKRAYYSNFGSKVDVMAPGGDMRAAEGNGILSTLNAGTMRPGADIYRNYQGTSMAAPHVAGVAALMLAKNPALTAVQVEALLKLTARPLSGPCKQGCGAGIVDAAAAVGAAAAAR
ncbi:MAG TPA: S8 family peptidase [Ideonella sp.]|nr:S8 family peptidase [Ideonella sp.]